MQFISVSCILYAPSFFARDVNPSVTTQNTEQGRNFKYLQILPVQLSLSHSKAPFIASAEKQVFVGIRLMISFWIFLHVCNKSLV